MPIYEYKCKNCEHQFEQLQKINDEPLSTCPECHKPELMKLVSNTSFQLKGTGWYATDFKDKKPKKEKAATETKDKAKATDKAETTKKTKTETKDKQKS